jgi:hypothetical protein
MINKTRVIQILSDAIVATFEQGLDDGEHFRTSLANSCTSEQLSEITQDDIKAALLESKADLLNLTFVMIDELINKK